MGDQGLASYLRAAALGSVEEFAARLKANTTPAFRHQLAQLLDASIAPSELCEAKGCDLKAIHTAPLLTKSEGRVVLVGWRLCQRQGCGLGYAVVWISPEGHVSLSSIPTLVKASPSPKRTPDEAQAFPRDYWGFAEHYR